MEAVENNFSSEETSSLPPLDCCAFDDDSSTSSYSIDDYEFSNLDECLDAFSIAGLVRGRKRKQQRLEEEEQNIDRRPIAFVRFNSRVGKPKPVTLRALLDSGGGGTLVCEEFTKKLKLKPLIGESEQVWNTPGGPMTTKKRVKAQFTIPELQDDRLIEWDVHVTKDLGSYDMIIGRDLLEFLGIDV